MKKWTVMLIPHDRGSSRTLNLSAYQLWLALALVVSLAFAASFYYKRHQIFMEKVARQQQVIREFELQSAKHAATVTPLPGLTAQERSELEQRIRAEYEASVAVIKAQLSELKDFETQARAMTGIAPRTAPKDLGSLASRGGKGGGAGSLSAIAYERADAGFAPPSVIYGLSQPSADLIVQEINLRTASLKALVTDLKVREDQIARLPAIWPTASRFSQVSSPFGYRKDPYGLRMSHHDGTDITAPYGSPILATAKGVVVYSDFDGGGLGNLIKIDHGNGIETCYGHLQVRLVHVGDRVERKTVVGRLGTTGRSTGPHLHYEVHINGRAVDAAKYFRE